MKQWATWAGIAMAGLAVACGGGEDRSASEAPAAPAANAPTAAAREPATAPEMPAAAAEMPDVSDAAQGCLALAVQQKWSEALEPCTQAAKEHPTDLRIKHAMQQAQAAAGD